MGNSEVGHLNLGAGSVVRQDLTRIDDAVRDGVLDESPVLREAMTGAPRVHLIGLVSDGGVHSSLEHLDALIRLAADLAVPDLVIHAFTDGRDTSPTGGEGFLATVEDWCTVAGDARIGTVIGRYFAMDRDKRWDRLQQAYDLLVHGRGGASRAERARGGARRLRPRGDRRVHHRDDASARRRAYAPGTASSGSTSAPTGCARSAARSPSRASPTSTAAARRSSSATRA